MRCLPALLLLLPSLAAAQWPTTAWHVVCTDATRAGIERSLLDEGATPQEAREGAERECDDAHTTPASAAALARLDLERSSEWYSAMGFRVPVVETSDGRYKAYLADELLSDPASIGEYGYVPETMVLRSTFYIEVSSGGSPPGGAPGGETSPYEPACETPRPGGSGGGEPVYTGVETVVHELYHAIQASYSSSLNADSWIAEGMAEGAMFAWILQTRGYRSGYSAPFLNHSLHLPEGRTEDDRYGAGYWRGNFWSWLGWDIDPSNLIVYTDPLLQGNLHTQHGLPGIHDGLKRWHEEGLYHYYPRFIAEDGSSRYLYGRSGCSSLDISFAGGTIEREMTATVKPVAAHHHRLIVNDVLAEEAYGIVVEIEDDHPDLHLAVGPLLFNEETDTARRNRFQTVMIGDGEPDTLMIRVANIAPDPTASRERSYTLNVRLSRVEPCSEYALVAALNPTSSEAREQVEIAAAYRRYQRAIDTEEVVYPLGLGDLRLAGDGGAACVSHFGTSDLEWTSDQDEDFDYEGTAEELIARYMPQAVEETGLTEAQIRSIIDDGDFPPGATPDQIMRLMAFVREVAAQPLTDDPGQSGVFFHIFAPNLIPALVGGISSESLSNEENVLTRHGGVGGWGANAAANLIVYLPGTAAAGIEGGQSYEALAYALSPNDTATPPQGPETNAALYTTWDGEWKTLRCQGTTDEYFVGGQTTYWGRLTGTVTIDSVTPASIEGSFSLSGPGTRETVTYRQVRRSPYDPTCPYSVEEEENWDAPGVSASGTFSAPNFHGPGTFIIAGVGRAVPVGSR